MSLKKAVYRLAVVAWAVFLFGGVLYIDMGLAEPWLSNSDIPGGTNGAMVGAIVGSIVGGKIVKSHIARLERTEWHEVGRQAGFRVAGNGGGENGGELTDTVNGRTVTLRSDRRESGGGQTSMRYVWHTFGEAKLAAPATEGVVVGNAGESVSARIGNIDFDQMAETAPAMDEIVATEAGDLFFAGTSAAVVEAVADGLSGDALGAIKDLEIVAVGDASSVVGDWAEAYNEGEYGVGSSFAEYPVNNLLERVPGDTGTVTVETRSEQPTRDVDELHRLAEGTVAIADAFEDATARTPASEE